MSSDLIDTASREESAFFRKLLKINFYTKPYNRDIFMFKWNGVHSMGSVKEEFNRLLPAFERLLLYKYQYILIHN